MLDLAANELHVNVPSKVLLNKSAVEALVVEQMTNDPRFKRSNPAPAWTRGCILVMCDPSVNEL
jgi:hypothetical protein